MWAYNNIQVFAIFATLLIVEILNWQWCVDVLWENYDDSIMAAVFTILAMLIPIGGVAIVAILGFYQDWQDYKNGRSR